MTPGADGRTPSGTTARTVAQAKVNLFLRILAREASGYHQLETLFCRLELGDQVTVRTGVSGRSLDCTGDVIPPNGLGAVERNLAWRAATTYGEATGWPNAWAIEIEKHIPVGGGLGGGSADAGAVLRCLNALAPTPLPNDALLDLAAPLGADVPFLTIDAPLALGWGRGERLLALSPLPGRDVALVCFPFGVPTGDAYRWLDDERHGATPQAAAFDVGTFESWDSVARLAHNDFETVVPSRFPEIASALTALQSRAEQLGSSAITLMSGSGATVFVVSDALPLVMSAAHGLPWRDVHTRTAMRVVAVEVSG